MATAGRAIAPYLQPSGEAPNPRAPGPFAFADSGYVEQILQNAGFSEIQIKAYEESLKVADTLAEAVQFQTRVGRLRGSWQNLKGTSALGRWPPLKTRFGPLMGEADCISTRQFGSSAPKA